MKEGDWAGRVARLPDEDLIEIVSSGDTGGFEPTIIAAATAELNRRKPAAEVVTEAKESVLRKQRATDALATEPLSNVAWAAYVVFGPIFLFTVTSVIFLTLMGHDQKARDAVWAIVLSFVFWGLISAAMAFFFA